jgi:hypothetical protein
MELTFRPSLLTSLLSPLIFTYRYDTRRAASKLQAVIWHWINAHTMRIEICVEQADNCNI